MNLNVSKSSINAVIKEFKLSNPVGRKAKTPPKNFNIPLEKKEQLLAEVVPFLPATEKIDMPAVVNEENVTEEIVVPLSLRKDPLIVNNERAPAIDDSENSSIQPEETAVLREKAGIFFVRALMQDTLGQHLIGDVLAKASAMAPETAPVLDAALFLNLFNVSRINDIHGDQLNPLWHILEVDPAQGFRVLEMFFGKDLQASLFNILLDVELNVLLARAAYFRFITMGGTSVAMTADLSSIFQPRDNNKPVTIFKAVQAAIDQVVSLRKPLIINMMGIDVLENKEALLRLSGQIDQLDKIELWAENNEIVWEHILKSDIRREIIVAIDYSERMLRQVILKSIENSRQYCDNNNDQKYALNEGEWTGFEVKQKWRMIVVEQEFSEQKRMLLTNMPEFKASMMEVFEYYQEKAGLMQPTGIFDRGNFKTCLKLQFKTNEDVFTKTQNIFKHFENILIQFLQPLAVTSSQLSQIYDLSAYVYQGQSAVRIKFVVPSNFTETQLLESILTRIGSGFLSDQNDRRYYFTIIKNN
ncbi:MAG: hypothetical protein V2A70_04220 [Candidatus Omnitrophota bacterium]